MVFIRTGETGKVAQQREINRTIILNGFLRYKNISRTDLAKKFNLSKSTVTRLVNHLISENMIREVGSLSRGLGRKAIVLSLNPDYKKAVAIKIGVTMSTIARINFAMKIEDYLSFSTPEDPYEFINNVIEGINRLFPEKKDKIHAIGIGVPGIVDNSFQNIIVAPNLRWKDVPLASLLSEKIKEFLEIDVPVKMDNEANLAVIAEGMLGTKIGYNDLNIVYVFIGEGIGTGLIIDGKLHRGSKNTAGEFGHMVVSKDGIPCKCGNEGCWERYASLSSSVSKNLGIDLRKEKIGDKDENLLKDFAYEISVGIINIVNGLNPDVIIIGGPLVTSKFVSFWEEVRDEVVKNVRKYSITPSAGEVKIELTSFLDCPAELIGAGIWAFWDIFEGPVLSTI
ncbi:MAG: ROK family protein [Dictyoglomus sp.]|nr:ROK family protein [Dictyoglomus sp.]MCX7941480.1 ROK family protein [Dictyoglomaceae bacterium]MDW8187973.1 ROK family transcriptional regulator [Dictyoglomus sp.]